MSALLCLEAAEVPTLEVASWRAELVHRLELGRRLVTLYGRHEQAGRQQTGVIVTAILQGAGGALEALRTTAPRDTGYEQLTSSFPAFHCFERELHEQTGLALPGHPWLKPVRFQGQDKAAIDAYPYFRIDGKEVHEVAVGPIHAGVIEPGSFRFMCLGEQVHHLEIQLGYQHRAVEPRLLGVEPRRLAPVVETIAGDTSVAHAWAFCAGLERLAGCQLAEDVELARAFVLELERVAMHLAGLSGMCADIGFLQGASTYGRLRTTAINTTMRLCGSRFGRGALRPGGLGLSLPASLVEQVSANVELLRTDLEIINEHFLASRTVNHRLEGAGVLSPARAKELGVVGLAARASGLAIDGRTQGIWQSAPLRSVTVSEGDCMARAKVRIKELDESLAWLAQVLAGKAQFAAGQQRLGPLSPRTLVVSTIEGWRGEVVHCLETGGEGELVHYKVQDPSLRNWMGLAVAVRQNEISDFPICNKSFDLSYSGHDL